ncbi:MAG: phosphopantothenoylcysteine decarboxylase, partial [Planctomycetota bacterium]
SRCTRNPDILVELAPNHSDQVIVGFSLDSHIDIEAAARKRKAKGMDVIVANSQHAFGGVSTDAVVIGREGTPEAAPSTKSGLARELVTRVEGLLADVRKQRTPSMRMNARRRIIREEE